MITKKRLIKASIEYLNECKRSYTEADIVVYRFKADKLGIEILRRRSAFKIVLGGFLCVVGALTLPFPTGSVFMIGFGCSLMVDGGLDLWGYYRKIKGLLIFEAWRFGLR